MANSQIHVTPDPTSKGRWKVEQAGSNRELGSFNTKEEAVTRAREVSTRENAELVIHDHRGQIQEKDSHGNDPYPPKG